MKTAVIVLAVLVAFGAAVAVAPEASAHTCEPDDEGCLAHWILDGHCVNFPPPGGPVC